MAVVQRKLARSSKYANIFVFQRAYPARPDEIEFHGCVSTVKRYAVPLRCYSTTVCVRATFFPLSPRYARFSFFLSPANRKIVIRKNGSLKSGEMTNVVACFHVRRTKFAIHTRHWRGILGIVVNTNDVVSSCAIERSAKGPSRSRYLPLHCLVS